MRSKSGGVIYKGVQYCPSRASPKKYMARIYIDNSRIFLGYYLTQEEAASKYNEAAIEYFKEFANLNIIKEFLP